MMESASQLLLSASPLQLHAAISVAAAQVAAAEEEQQKQENETINNNIKIEESSSEGNGGEEAAIPNSPAAQSPCHTTNAIEAAFNLNFLLKMETDSDDKLTPLEISESMSSLNGSLQTSPTTIITSKTPPINGKSMLQIIKPPGDEKEERPSLSYKDLIIEAIESNPDRRLKLSEIYQVIKYLHPYYQKRADQWGWQNSIRHNLSLHDCFVKLPLKQTSANGVVGHFWTVVHRNPEDKQGPTRRRSRAANGGGPIGKSSKKITSNQINSISQVNNTAGGKAKGLKGRQSVSLSHLFCSDSGVMSDDCGNGTQSGNISPTNGNASAPASLLEINTSNDLLPQLTKFQALQSPLALNSLQHSALQFALKQQTSAATNGINVNQNNILSPLEIVLGSQAVAQQLLAAQTATPFNQQQLLQFSPIPGKTAPAQPALLEQHLQQLLALATNAQDKSIQPETSSSPSLLAANPLAPTTSNSTLATTPTAANGGLNLLSQLASQALSSSSPQPSSTITQQDPTTLAVAAAAAAELQHIQLVQLYAQQQQLQQQLALIEHTHREHLHLRLLGGHRYNDFPHGHSAPLSPVVHEQLSTTLNRNNNNNNLLLNLTSTTAPSSPSLLTNEIINGRNNSTNSNTNNNNNNQSILTQLLLNRLFSSNSINNNNNNENSENNINSNTEQLSTNNINSSPPPPLSSSAPNVSHSPVNEIINQQQQIELQQAALLLEQYQQQQQQLLLIDHFQQQQQQLAEVGQFQALTQAFGNAAAAAAAAAAVVEQVQEAQQEQEQQQQQINDQQITENKEPDEVSVVV